ncbi:hypothetical protein [Aneurinibacillus migulanus]|uniref:hypothetical protein n=1 Tax=Aneurinibacillus migulanus TaxID=47500 RepID=UPI00209D2FEA|nr:hypothetical protein [Aneurinibacillus migulanus]MCP1355348.1 hypothetical protein [Aneurinibacillus migulanus]
MRPVLQQKKGKRVFFQPLPLTALPSFLPSHHKNLSMSHLSIIHRLEGIRCTCRRAPSSFSRKEEIRPLCGTKAGPAKHQGFSGAGDEPPLVRGTVWWLSILDRTG